MLSRPLVGLLALVPLAVLLCSACWTDLATKNYPTELRVAYAVEQWRPAVEESLEAEGLDTDYHLPIALVTLACESKGDPDALGGGLYQFTRGLARNHKPGGQRW